MSEAQKGAKKNLFEKEIRVLRDSKAFMENENLSAEELRKHLNEINDHYEELVDQSKLITKVSDRLQNKINRINDTLELKNIELQDSLEALTKAKVGRRATTIVLIIFIGLFILIEGVVEPQIDDVTDQFFHDDLDESGIMMITLAIKGTLALLLRPIEKLVESILMKRVQKERLAEREKTVSGDITMTDTNILE